jgi:hypothetical protein
VFGLRIEEHSWDLRRFDERQHRVEGRDLREARPQISRAQLLESRQSTGRDVLDVVDAHVVRQALKRFDDGLSSGRRVEAAPVEQRRELEKLDFAALGQARSIAAAPRPSGRDAPCACGLDQPLANLLGASPAGMSRGSAVTRRRDGHGESVPRLKRSREQPISVFAVRVQHVELTRRAIARSGEALLELGQTHRGALTKMLSRALGHSLRSGQKALDHRERGPIELPHAFAVEVAESFF